MVAAICGYSFLEEKEESMAGMTHTVVARFDHPAPAREAMVDLEGKGFDADAINLLGQATAVPTLEGGLSADLAVSRRFVDSFARNGVLGALIGAALFIGVLLLMQVQPVGTAVVLGGLAGAIAGFLMGGFIGAARHIPVNEDALETYEIDPTDPEGVAVEVRVEDPAKAAEAVAVLRRHHPRQLERRAA
jgi:hypothetical protein